jgi:hypothetical protein
VQYRSAISLVVAAALAVPSLAACDSLNRALGKEKVIPDEFAVVSSAPLAIPPDYSLRPPRVSSTRDQETSPTDQARQSVFRAGEQQASLPAAQAQRSPGEDELLRQAGAADAPRDIRELVNNDSRNGETLESGFVDKLLFFGEGPKTAPSNEVIDPAKEAERLRGTQMAGKAPGPTPAPSTELSGTPTIERTTSKSWFSGLFSWL